MDYPNHIFETFFNGAVAQTQYRELINTIITTAKLLDYKISKSISLGKKSEYYNFAFEHENIKLIMIMEFKDTNLINIQLQINGDLYEEYNSRSQHQNFLNFVLKSIISEKEIQELS